MAEEQEFIETKPDLNEYMWEDEKPAEQKEVLIPIIDKEGH